MMGQVLGRGDILGFGGLSTRSIAFRKISFEVHCELDFNLFRGK